jgi:hypothetical protein
MHSIQHCQGTAAMETIIFGLIALACLAYLVVAVLRPRNSEGPP